jgi:hypothetical protein
LLLEAANQHQSLSLLNKDYDETLAVELRTKAIALGNRDAIFFSTS